MLEENIKKFFNLVESSQKILLLTHRHPDGDAIGSILSMQKILIKMNKDVLSYCVDSFPENFNYLPGTNLIKTDLDVIENEYDLIITLDCSDLYMTKIEEKIKTLKSKFGLVNIDHHITNPGFGDLNIIISNASSTTEVIYTIFENNQDQISADIATSLLTGIITDTGNFTNNATTKRSIEIASKLLAIGANFKEILRANVYNKTISVLKLWGIVLKRIVYDSELQMVETAVFESDLKTLDLDNEASEGISNYLNNLSSDIKFSILLKDNESGKIKGSLRTTRDDVDVSQIALVFGGGGHKKASGFEVNGHLELKNGMWKIVK